jgi:hypothetical protein
MEKEGTLPKPFQKMLGELKRLDDELGISNSFFKQPSKKEIEKRKKEKAREEVLKNIWQSWPRKVLLNKDVLQMRGNALKNPEVKPLLNKNHIRIEDCALVAVCWDEQHRGQRSDCPGFTSPQQIQNDLIGFGSGNMWLNHYDYYWGGRNDPVKILFKRSDNHRFKVVGVIQMFPQKEKKAA